MALQSNQGILQYILIQLHCSSSEHDEFTSTFNY